MKKLISILLVFLMALSLFGCTQDSEQPEVPVDTEKETTVETLEGNTGEESWRINYDESMKGVSLNLYGVTDAIVPVLEEFTKDTGIKVENLTMKNGEILQRIENEYDSGVVGADIWFTGGADAFINAAEKGLLVPYISPEAAEIPADMKDADGYWSGTSLTVVNWVVNKEIITELGLQIPSKWDDLLQPELKGLVSMPNPASSGTAYNTVSAILQTRGEEEGWSYIEKLVGQVPFFTARGSDPGNNVIAGEAAVGINAGVTDVEKTNPHVKYVYPEDGTGWWPQPIAILAGCKNPEAAKVFIDWVLSPKGLEHVAIVQYSAVVRDEVPIPEGIVAPSEVNLFPTDFKANAEDRDAILEKWSELVGE